MLLAREGKKGGAISGLIDILGSIG